MYITDFYMSLIIGVIATLIFVEAFGITPGGIIVASYLALVLDSPITLLLIFVVSFITYGIVNYVFPKFVILYGKRKFVVTLAVALVLKLIIEFIYPMTTLPILEFAGIGIIVPALLSNCYFKQGIKMTVVSTLAITVLVYAAKQVVYLVV